MGKCMFMNAGGADPSLGMTGAAAGESPVVSAVDADGKPTAWTHRRLATADTGYMTSEDLEAWQSQLSVTPTTIVYAKADDNGNILAYTDRACTEEIGAMWVMGLLNRPDALLICGNKTYRFMGLRESSYAPGDIVVGAFFFAEHAVDAMGNVTLKTETALLDVLAYVRGEVPAPITITTLTLGGA